MSIRSSGVRARRRAGRLPSPGHDHVAGHLGYVAHADRHGRHYLTTKPFDAPPTHELPYALRTFAHIVELLELDSRAQVLDAGCGPGWLAEFLARCGYWVTGVDVSPDMVAIARERVASRSTDAGLGIAHLAEFFAMPVADLPWKHRFDAVIVNDSLHHFDEESRTLGVLLDSLVPGGRIFIQEAAWPRRRRDAQTYIDEMERHSTLESPFRPGYLRRTLTRSGFTRVRRLAPIDRAFRAHAVLPAIWHTLGRTVFPKTNMFIAEAPAFAPGRPAFAADVEVTEASVGHDEKLHLRLQVTNRGYRYWPSGLGSTLPVGTVTIAPHVLLPSGDRLELPRIPLSRPMSPGEQTSSEAWLRIPGGPHDELLLSLVREGIEWFPAPRSGTASVDLRRARRP